MISVGRFAARPRSRSAHSPGDSWDPRRNCCVIDPGGTGGNPFCNVRWWLAIQCWSACSRTAAGTPCSARCLIRAGVVVDAVSAAEHRIAQGLPRDAQARSKVVAIRTDQRHGKLSVVRSGLADLHRDWWRGEALRQIQVHDAVILFRKRREVFIAHAQVQSQVAAQAPFILHKDVPGIAAKMVIVVAELHRSELRKPQQEVGKVVAAVQPSKGESAARVAVGQGLTSIRRKSPPQRQVCLPRR